MADYPISPLWRLPPADLTSRLERCLDRARALRDFRQESFVFFRADDVAVPGARFARLMELFMRRRVPLCLAVVPAWLTRNRWENLKSPGEGDPFLWCWHQHGWRHVNHEKEGKKQEFGPRRSTGQIRSDVNRGKDRLQDLMGHAFYPLFTPPWNRCSDRTLEVLKELGFRAVSRYTGALPPPPEGLTEFSANLDLHTRREEDPISGWEALFSDLERALSKPLCGIMIHHRRMNDAAFVFLEILLERLVKQKGVSILHFKDLSVLTTHAHYEHNEV